MALLRRCEATAHLPEALERFGIATLGALAALPRAAVADRFGRAGLRAHDLAHGRDTPLVPRRPGERWRRRSSSRSPPPARSSAARWSCSSTACWPVASAAGARCARSLSATLVEGGTWRERVVFREPLADAARMGLALGPRLELLPAPAEALRLTAERLGPPHAGERALFDDGSVQRRARLREAVRQARAVAGPEAALRVLAVDPDSRVPERRAVLTPFEP